MRSHIQLTPPGAEPVALEAVKAHLRIDGSADDPLLEGLNKAARMWCETYTRRAFVRQSWALWLSEPSACRELVLPRAPLLGVTRVQLFDENDVATDWENANYYVDVAAQPGRIVLRDGAVWPDLKRAANGMMVAYEAGYGDDGSAVPEDVKLAIKQLAAHWYENRGEAITVSAPALVPMTVQALLTPYRLMSMGGV